MLKPSDRSHRGAAITCNWPTAAFMPGAVRPDYEKWTVTFADGNQIHDDTLRNLRKAPTSPRVRGVHYRQTVVSGRYFQWHQEEAERAFTAMRTTPVGRLETFQREPNPCAN